MVAQYIGSSGLDQWWHWTAEHDIVALNIESSRLEFQEDDKDASVSKCIWPLSALEALRNALYKFNTYLLTYILTYLLNRW